MFLTISYVSNAPVELASGDIEALMIDVKEFNDTNNISGILIYSDFSFFQVIEGEFSIVKSLFDRIKQDYRHYNVLKILEVTSIKRRFHRYNTKFITHHKNKASTELLKLIQHNNDNMIDQKLHSLVIYQSKTLMNLS